MEPAQELCLPGLCLRVRIYQKLQDAGWEILPQAFSGAHFHLLEVLPRLRHTGLPFLSTGRSCSSCRTPIPAFHDSKPVSPPPATTICIFTSLSLGTGALISNGHFKHMQNMFQQRGWGGDSSVVGHLTACRSWVQWPVQQTIQKITGSYADEHFQCFVWTAVACM